MSSYLDDLIKALEAEAEEELDNLKKLDASRRFRPKNAGGPLKRTLQRLGTLRALQRAEKGWPRNGQEWQP